MLHDKRKPSLKDKHLAQAQEEQVVVKTKAKVEKKTNKKSKKK